MTDTVNNAIPLAPENTTDPAAGLNLALNVIDAKAQLVVEAIQNDPPGSPIDGDRYIVATGSGAWSGEDDRLARYVAIGPYWEFFDAKLVFNLTDGQFWYLNSGVWTKFVPA